MLRDVQQLQCKRQNFNTDMDMFSDLCTDRTVLYTWAVTKAMGRSHPDQPIETYLWLKRWSCSCHLLYNFKFKITCSDKRPTTEGRKESALHWINCTFLILSPPRLGQRFPCTLFHLKQFELYWIVLHRQNLAKCSRNRCWLGFNHCDQCNVLPYQIKRKSI